MKARQAPPGDVGQRLAGDFGRHEVGAARPSETWQDYLAEPDGNRVGIAASGGGVRSASFALGGLQVLRQRGVLGIAHHLACVSGGGYITIAHAVLAHESLREADPDGGRVPASEEALFGHLPPWAPDSPEERNLRDRLSYLAPGMRGKLWLGLNLLYGLVRHLLPFVASIYLMGMAMGLVLSGWLAPALDPACRPECPESDYRFGLVLLICLAGLAVAVVLVTVRTSIQKAAMATPDLGQRMMRYQRSATVAVIATGAVLFLFWAVPHIVLWMTTGIRDLGDVVGDVVRLMAVSGGIAAVASYAIKRWGGRVVRVAVGVLVALAGPLFFLAPFLGFTYWNAQGGADEPRLRVGLAVLSVAILLALFLVFDEVLSTAHLFYRERLATAFVGIRRNVAGDGPPRLTYDQPPWSRRLCLSEVVAPWVGIDPSAAKVPNLVVCAAVNVAEAPVGRLGGSFTFEVDKVGGPLTGYMSTPWLEEHATGGAGTLPGLMAVSGAAAAPSMGKMTIPGLRFLMAIFNIRLGVWLPNPHRSPHKVSAADIRTGTFRFDLDATEPEVSRKQRPGGLYVFREAFGSNGIDRNFVYVSDGGHWENIGLVELLRRGCGRVVVMDGSGGTNVWFDTISEAIALARADLGVEIDIDLTELRADDATGFSPAPFAVGTITFPNGEEGSLVYVRAVIPADAPPEIKSYTARDHKFPNHPTSDQLFGDATFEAYRSLGRHLMERAFGGGWFGRADADHGDPASWPRPEPRTRRENVAPSPR